MKLRYQANEPAVAAETIDGEAVIVNLRSGDYFSAAGVGCLVWDWLSQGATRDEVTRELAARYRVEEPVAASAVESFLSDLLAHELLREWPNPPEVVSFTPPTNGDPASHPDWDPPKLAVYSDMKDLLLLDPIHEVEDAGWPIAKQRTPPSE